MNIDDTLDLKFESQDDPPPVQDENLNEIMKDIILQQARLMDKYHEIEAKNGVAIPSPDTWGNLNDRVLQQRIKDMLWRFTEEMAEAYEVCIDSCLEDVANVCHPRNTVLSGPFIRCMRASVHFRHFIEEVIDALHFLTEATIIAGMSQDIANNADELWSESQITPVREDHSVPGKPSHRGGFYSSRLRDRPMMLVAAPILVSGRAANTLKNKPWKNTEMVTDVNKFQANMVETWVAMFSLITQLGITPRILWHLYSAKKKVNQFRQDSNY